MAIDRIIKLNVQERVDASTFDWQDAVSERINELKGPPGPVGMRGPDGPPGFKPKSYEEILTDMIYTMKRQMPQQFDFTPGSMILTFIEVMAIQMSNIQMDMYNLMMYQGASQASIPTYTYPDGSKSHTKPADGAVFRYITNNSGAPREECYMYDGMLDSWKWIGAKILVIGGGGGGSGSGGIDKFDIKIGINDIKVANRKCECGSEKVGSPIHSSWCEKYTK